jgi:hypothetical protein
MSDGGTPAGTSVPAAPARRSRSELRALLIQAGLEVLRQDGLGTGAEKLTFKRVFERVAATAGVRVTNASVIGRIWDSLAEYQSAVAAAVAAEEVTDQEDAVVAAITGYLATVDRSTPEARRDAVREVMRLAADANLTAGTTSRPWATVIGIWALASGARRAGPPGPVYEALRTSYVALEDRAVAETVALLAYFGLRVRPPLDVRQFTRALTALVEGSALRDRAGPGMRGIELPTGPDGALQAWTVLGVGMDALVDQFFEMDPDWAPEPGR